MMPYGVTLTPCQFFLFLYSEYWHFSSSEKSMSSASTPSLFPLIGYVRVFILNPSEEEEIRRFLPIISQFNFESFFSPSSGFVFETVQYRKRSDNRTYTYQFSSRSSNMNVVSLRVHSILYLPSILTSEL